MWNPTSFSGMVPEIYSNREWDSACLVGLGRHSLNRLLPQLELIYPSKISIVSSKNNKNNLNCRFFRTLDESLNSLNNNTLYIIATPPSTHFSISKKILIAGKDIMVEKPSFLSIREFNILKNIASSKNLVLIEMLMYMENISVNEILNKIKNNPSKIKSFNFNFTIPSTPKDTYRTEKYFETSLLSDIGIYPISFLAHLDFPLRSLKYNRNYIRSSKKYTYNIQNEEEPNIQINIGCSGIYTNSLRVEFLNEFFVEISPFFYGLEGSREVITMTRSDVIIKVVNEENSFKKLFQKSRQSWLKNQGQRFNIMAKIIETIETFSNSFESDTSLK